MADLVDLREAVRKLNPRLLVTASHGGDASREEILAYIKSGFDFVSIHRSRDADAAGKAETGDAGIPEVDLRQRESGAASI